MENKQSCFEQDLMRLEQIVRIMEKGDAPLEDSLKLFQEGTELVKRCSKLLNEAQMQVNLILADGDGNPVEEAFSHDIDI